MSFVRILHHGFKFGIPQLAFWIMISIGIPSFCDLHARRASSTLQGEVRRPLPDEDEHGSIRHILRAPVISIVEPNSLLDDTNPSATLEYKYDEHATKEFRNKLNADQQRHFANQIQQDHGYGPNPTGSVPSLCALMFSTDQIEQDHGDGPNTASSAPSRLYLLIDRLVLANPGGATRDSTLADLVSTTEEYAVEEALDALQDDVIMTIDALVTFF